MIIRNDQVCFCLIEASYADNFRDKLTVEFVLMKDPKADTTGKAVKVAVIADPQVQFSVIYNSNLQYFFERTVQIEIAHFMMIFSVWLRWELLFKLFNLFIHYSFYILLYIVICHKAMILPIFWGVCVSSLVLLAPPVLGCVITKINQLSHAQSACLSLSGEHLET